MDRIISEEYFVKGIDTVPAFGVRTDRICRVEFIFTSNNEPWLKLTDVSTNEQFASPTIFWEEYRKEVVL